MPDIFDTLTSNTATLDIFDELKPSKEGDIFDQITPSKSESLLKSTAKGFAKGGATFMPKAFWGGAKILKDVANQYPAFTPWAAITQFIPEGYPEKQIAEVEKTAEYLTPEERKGWTQYIPKAAETLGQMAGSAVATGGVGTLPAMAGGAGIDRTLQTQKEGESLPKSLLAGGMSGVAEYATEKLPIKYLTQIGLPYLKRLAGGLISDVPGEIYETFVEMKSIDEGLLGKKYTPQEYAKAIIDTAATSAMTTGIATTAVQPFRQMPPKRPVLPEEQEEVTPQPARPPRDLLGGQIKPLQIQQPEKQEVVLPPGEKPFIKPPEGFVLDKPKDIFDELQPLPKPENVEIVKPPLEVTTPPKDIFDELQPETPPETLPPIRETIKTGIEAGESLIPQEAAPVVSREELLQPVTALNLEMEIVAEKIKTIERKPYTKDTALRIKRMNEIDALKDQYQELDKKRGEASQPFIKYKANVPGAQAETALPEKAAPVVSKEKDLTQNVYYTAKREVGDIKEGKQLGTFYTQNKDIAKKYGGEITERQLNIKNPFIVSPSNKYEIFTTNEINKLLESSNVKYQFTEESGYYPDTAEEIWRFLDTGGVELKNAIKKAGYDSVKFPDTQGYSEFITTLVFDKKADVPGAQTKGLPGGKPKFSQPKMFEGEKADIAPKMEAELLHNNEVVTKVEAKSIIAQSQQDYSPKAIKQHKEYLFDQIDEAIKNAQDYEPRIPETDYKGNIKVETLDASLAKSKEAVGFITIEVPGDGKFRIINSKQSLTKFKNDVVAKFPTTKISNTQKIGKAPMGIVADKAVGIDNAMEGTYNKQSIHGNSEMVLFTPLKTKPKSYGTDPDGARVAMPSRIDDLIDKETTHYNVDDIVFFVRKLDEAEGISDIPLPHLKEDLAVAELYAGDKYTPISQKYYNYIKAHFPDATFKITDRAGSAVQIYSNKKLVGLVMPLEIRDHAPHKKMFNPKGEIVADVPFTKQFKGNVNFQNVKDIYETQEPKIGDTFVSAGGKEWTVTDIKKADTKGGLKKPATEIEISFKGGKSKTLVYTEKIWDKSSKGEIAKEPSVNLETFGFQSMYEAGEKLVKNTSEYVKAQQEYKKILKEGGVTEDIPHDIGKFKQFISFPHTVAKRFPKTKVFQERTYQQVEQFENLIGDLKETLDPYIKNHDKKVDQALIEGYVSPTPKLFSDQELKTRGLSQEEIQAYRAVAPTMKTAAKVLEEHLLAVGKDPQEVQAWMADFQESYIPLSRFGKFYVSVKDAEGKGITTPTFDSVGQARRAVVDLRRQYPDAKITMGNVKRLAPEAYEGMPINVLAFLSKFDENLSANFASVIGKGFPGHLLQVKKTPGFETNLKKSISDYAMSLARYISINEYQRDITKMLNDKNIVDPKREAGLWGYWKRYSDYIVSNPKEFAKFRQFFYYYYLGANIKSALLNATQPLTTTYPVLSKYAKQPEMLMAKAFKLAAHTQKGLMKINPELAYAVQSAIHDGTISEQNINELRGLRQGKSASKIGNALSFLFSSAEKYNRKVSFIAMYMAAREGYLKKGQPRSHAEIQKMSEDFVKETQYDYRKVDRPELARGWRAPLFTFRMFSGNYLSMLKNLMVEKEFAALARSLGVMLILGGVSAIPGWKELEKALELMGYDPKKSFREYMGKEEGELALHGLPFKTGANISGALGTVELLPGDIQQGVTAGIANLVLGVPTDLPKRFDRARQYLFKLNSPYRAVEAVMPEFVRNPMVAIRWIREEGIRSPKFEKLGTATNKDIFFKAIGIQPSNLTNIYELKHSAIVLKNRVTRNTGEYNFRLARALYVNDIEEYKKTLDEIIKHNQKSKSELDLIIPDKSSIKRQVQGMHDSRVKDIKEMPKRGRRALMELEEVY